MIICILNNTAVGNNEVITHHRTLTGPQAAILFYDPICFCFDFSLYQLLQYTVFLVTHNLPQVFKFLFIVYDKSNVLILFNHSEIRSHIYLHFK